MQLNVIFVEVLRCVLLHLFVYICAVYCLINYICLFIDAEGVKKLFGKLYKGDF